MAPASRRSWPLGRGVHGGSAPTGLGAISSCLADLPRLRRTVLPRGVAVSETDEALYRGPPVVKLVCCWRVVYEQLSSRQSFCWSGGQRWRMARGAGCARTSNYVRRSNTRTRQSPHARASTLVCMLALSIL